MNQPFDIAQSKPAEDAIRDMQNFYDERGDWMSMINKIMYDSGLTKKKGDKIRGAIEYVDQMRPDWWVK